MNSTFASSYKLLRLLFSELELQRILLILHPGVDFSKAVKISFQDTILSLFNHGWLFSTSHDFFPLVSC